MKTERRSIEVVRAVVRAARLELRLTLCAQVGDVIAVGSGGVIARWNGTAWSVEREGGGAHLASVWGSAPDDVWAVGGGATVMHFDGEGWTPRELFSKEFSPPDP